MTAIAADCRKPGRVGGFHFFNPVPLMKVVEVIDGALTEPWVCDALAGMAERMGHTPVRAKDTPGFIVNHAGRAYSTESLAILEDGIAETRQIDDILRDTVGFRMGPFQLFDLTALDVSHPATEAIYHQFYQDPRFRPSYILRQRLTAGLLGRKTGRGFYSYGEDAPAEPVEEAPAEIKPVKVWVSRRDANGSALLLELLEKLDVALDDGDRPDTDSLCLVTPLGEDATTAALSQDIDPERTIALDTIMGLDKHRTLMTTPVTRKEYSETARGIFSGDGMPATVIKDSPGFVVQRMIAMVVNTGCGIAQKRIASPEDIDKAVQLGLGYPYGPLALGNKVGPARVLQILRTLQQYTGDPRYRPTLWLSRRAQLGISLLNTD